MSKCVDRTCLENVFGERHKYIPRVPIDIETKWKQHKDHLLRRKKFRKIERKKRDAKRLTKKQRQNVRRNKSRMVCGRRTDCYHCNVSCPTRPHMRNRKKGNS